MFWYLIPKFKRQQISTLQDTAVVLSGIGTLPPSDQQNIPHIIFNLAARFLSKHDEHFQYFIHTRQHTLYQRCNDEMHNKRASLPAHGTEILNVKIKVL